MRCCRAIALAWTVAVLAASAAGTAAAGSTVTAKARVATCTRATIGGKRRCLAPGQACSPRYEKQYELHGYICRKSHGRYRLAHSGLTF
jgi:hypothetical protein